MELKFDLACRWHDRKCNNNLHCDGCEFQPAPEDKPNGKAAPVKIDWEYEWGLKIPACPFCGPTPTLDRCFFCGQPFIQEDEELQEYIKPPEEVRMNCILCGGINTMVGVRVKGNGHFHGRCEQCGARVVE